MVARIPTGNLHGAWKRIAILLAAALWAAEVDASERQLLPNIHNAFGPYMDLIDELGARRRVNVLYPNPQSLFDGLEVGFVSVGTGNPSFLRRDLVVRMHGPVIFGRVYDGRIEDNDDLGPRWRLSLAEELWISGDDITYVDGLGGRQAFRRSAGRYKPHPPNPWHARTTISFEDGRAVLALADGSIRTFGAEGKRRGKQERRLLQTSLKTKHGVQITFSYAGGLLAAATSDDAALFTVSRDKSGRVAGVTDRHGRTVTYSYTGSGLLKDVYDMAGNLWWHQYDDDDRLTSAVGANGRPYLRLGYDRSGRVGISNSGRLYRYRYGASSTTVTEATGESHVFSQDASGITVKYGSASHHWELELDAENRVQSLVLPNRTLDYSYDSEGNLQTVDDSLLPGTRKFNYDQLARLASITVADEKLVEVSYSRGSVQVSGPQMQFAFTTAPSGLVSRLKGDPHDTEFSYDRNGYLVRLRRADRSVSFERDGVGRVTSTTYPNGKTNAYSYDGLGNRHRIKYADGASAVYSHDAAGNITAVDLVDAEGKTQRQTMDIADMNRVNQINYGGWGAVAVEYDEMGRPVAFEMPEDKVSVEYGESGAVERLFSQSREEEWTPTDDGPSQSPVHEDPRLVAVERDRVLAPRRDYGVVGFSADTFAPIVHDYIERAVEGVEDARMFASVAAAVLWDETVDPLEFEKPSNPIFQPDEYRATNCCVPCLVNCGYHCSYTGLCFCTNGIYFTATITCGGVSSYPDLARCLFITQNAIPIRPDGCTGTIPDPCAKKCGLAKASTSFAPACNAHDRCYRRCGSSKIYCDATFLANLEAICDRAYPDCTADECDEYNRQRETCKRFAAYYASAPFLVGRHFYRKGQVKFCSCCKIRITFGSSEG